MLPTLRSERVTYFPIRHHSPACAAHLRRWLEQHRPASVLIEGPASFTNLIELLVDEKCVCPVAVYTSYVDKRGRVKETKGVFNSIWRRHPDGSWKVLYDAGCPPCADCR